MEEKKYEAGRVEITSTEYRDLVTEAVESKEVASRLRSENWKLESEIKELKTRLSEANKNMEEMSKRIAELTEENISYKARCFTLMDYTKPRTEDSTNA